MRNLIKSIASLIVLALVAPMIQAPAAKLAEKLGIDTVYTKRWEASTAFLSDLAQNPWYIFAFGCMVGVAVALWIVALFPEKDAEAFQRPIQSASPTFFSPFGRYKIGWINIYKTDANGNLLPAEGASPHYAAG